MGFGAKNGAVLRAIVELLAFVRSSSRTTFHRGEAKKKKHVNDLCQISSKKTNHLHHHVETKRGDVRRKSARQQQQNENVETGNDRAEERDGCVFLYLFPLLSSASSSREMKGNRSFDFGFLPSVRTMLCRVTDVVFFLSLFQTRSSLMNLSYYVQLEAKAA